MNSSVVTDDRYKAEIEDIYYELVAMDIDPVDKWDLFITVVQGTTIPYTKLKARIKHALKNFLLKTIQNLEELDNFDIIPS